MAKSRAISRVVYVKSKARHHSAKFTLPVAVLAGLAIPTAWTIHDFKEGGLEEAGNSVIARMTGFNPRVGKFEGQWLWQGLIPVLGGIFVHKFVGQKMGVNRALSSAGVPILRL